MLKNARAELETLLSSRQISENEFKLRMKLLEATVNHKMGFDNDYTHHPNPEYYEEKDGAWVLKPGKVAKGLDDRVNDRTSGHGYNLTGCTRAIQP